MSRLSVNRVAITVAALLVVAAVSAPSILFAAKDEQRRASGAPSSWKRAAGIFADPRTSFDPTTTLTPAPKKTEDEASSSGKKSGSRGSNRATTTTVPTTTRTPSTTAPSTTAPPSTAPSTTAPPTTTPPTTAPPSTAPPSGSLARPFSASSPWNTRLGATNFDGRPVITTANSTPWINCEEYSVPVVRASATDPSVTITVSSGTNPGPVTLRIPAGTQAAAGGDRHLVVISPDGRYSDEFWNLDLGARTAGTYIHVDLAGSGVGIGWVRATGVSLLGGLIRSSEMSAIPHALAMALPNSLLGSGYVWPAISSDASGPGFVREGSLLAIPPGTPKPAGLSALGSAIFDALASYGAYVVDRSGGNAAVLYVEPTANPGAVSAARGEISAILPLLRMVVR